MVTDGFACHLFDLKHLVMSPKEGGLRHCSYLFMSGRNRGASWPGIVGVLIEGWGSQCDFGTHTWILRNTLNHRSSKQTGYFFLLGLIYTVTRRVLSKPIPISRTLACDVCTWYILIRLLVMLGILGLVYFLPKRNFFLWCSLVSNNILKVLIIEKSFYPVRTCCGQQ